MLGVLARSAYGYGLTPFGFVTWRAGIGALVIMLIIGAALRRGGRLVGWRSIDARGRASLGIAGLVGAMLNIAMFLAFARLPVAIVLLCFYLYPAIVTGVAALLGWEPMDRVRGTALVVAPGEIRALAGQTGRCYAITLSKAVTGAREFLPPSPVPATSPRTTRTRRCLPAASCERGPRVAEAPGAG